MHDSCATEVRVDMARWYIGSCSRSQSLRLSTLKLFSAKIFALRFWLLIDSLGIYIYIWYVLEWLRHNWPRLHTNHIIVSSIMASRTGDTKYSSTYFVGSKAES